MATLLKSVTPKQGFANPYYFDLSHLNNAGHDVAYEYAGVGFTFDLLLNNDPVWIDVYVNGVRVIYRASVGVRSEHMLGLRTYDMTDYSAIPGDLSNAEVYATYSGTSNRCNIVIKEGRIFKDYHTPENSGLGFHYRYANAPSKQEFVGNRYCTGVRVHFNESGQTHTFQAEPGTLVVNGDDTRGEFHAPPGAYVAGNNTLSVWPLNHTKQGEVRRYDTQSATVFPTTVKSLKFANNNLSKDKPNICTWVASPQQTKYQIKYKPQNGVEVTSEETESTSQFHTFPISTFSEGLGVVSVRIYDGFYWSSWQDINITAYSHKLTSFEPDGVAQNKDLPITVTWDSSDPQTKYEFEYTSIKSTKLITGTTAKSYTIPANSFHFETVTMRVRTYNGYIWSAWKSGSFKTDGIDYPNNLEPKGVAQNKDSPIKISWDAMFQTSWELNYTINGVSTSKVGTTQRSYTIPANTIGVGTVEWELRINTGLIVTEWKKVSFIAFGKPETPTITSPTIFNTAYPTFTWEAVGQTGYNMQVLEGETVVYDTGDVISNVRLHSINKALDNNKAYILRLSIKNQYGYNSDYATQTFNIAYVEIQRPSFVIFSDYTNGAHIIDVTNISSPIFKECEVHRKEKGGDWIRIAKNLPRVTQFRDVTTRSDLTYQYKVRAVSTSGGISDSDVKLSYTKLKYAQLFDMNSNEVTILKSNFKRNVTLRQDMSEKFYAGRRTPVANYGEKRYKVINISFAVKTFAEQELFEQLYYSRPTLLYRDTKGEKIYCYISQKPKITPTKNYWTIEFVVTELSHEEGV